MDIFLVPHVVTDNAFYLMLKIKYFLHSSDLNFVRILPDFDLITMFRDGRVYYHHERNLTMFNVMKILLILHKFLLQPQMVILQCL